MKIGSVVIYYPGCVISKEHYRTALVSKVYECPNAPHMLKLALIPEFTGEIEIAQSAYHISDQRLKTPTGAWSEAATRNGCWETLSEFNARSSKKQTKNDTDVAKV